MRQTYSLHRVGGTSGSNINNEANGYLSDEIVIGASEEDMHRDPYLSYLNRTTPLAMAQLLIGFTNELRKRITVIF